MDSNHKTLLTVQGVSLERLAILFEADKDDPFPLAAAHGSGPRPQTLFLYRIHFIE
jgi:hypothetical protein